MKMKRNTLGVIIALVVIMILSTGVVLAATDEQENNDTKQDANVIKMGDTVFGVTDDYEYVSYYKSGIDWFRFKAPISGTAKVVIYADEATSGRDTGAAIGVFDSNEQHLASAYDTPNTSKGGVCTFGVRSGKTYYLKVHGDYCGFYDPGLYYHFKLSYNIGRTTITSIKGKLKAFTVKWNKKSKASFYQVQYVRKSVYQDYGWNNAKTVKVGKKSKSKTIKKLTRKRVYYVRVRVARTIEGKTYYSSWTPKKAVITK